MASVASDLYGMNLWHFIEEMGGATRQATSTTRTMRSVPRSCSRPVRRSGLRCRWRRREAPAAAKAASRPPAPRRPTSPAGKPAEAPSTPKVSPPKNAHGPRRSVRAVGRERHRAQRPRARRGRGVGRPALRPSRCERLGRLVPCCSSIWTVFVLAIFVGMQVVWNRHAGLGHTPLMSVTNAISGIIVVGGLLSGIGKLDTPVIVAVVATMFATINIAGGFIITRGACSRCSGSSHAGRPHELRTSSRDAAYLVAGAPVHPRAPRTVEPGDRVTQQPVRRIGMAIAILATFLALLRHASTSRRTCWARSWSRS